MNMPPCQGARARMNKQKRNVIATTTRPHNIGKPASPMNRSREVAGLICLCGKEEAQKIDGTTGLFMDFSDNVARVVKPDMPSFLYDYDSQRLYGIFAISEVSAARKFVLYVKQKCLPLEGAELEKAITEAGIKLDNCMQPLRDFQVLSLSKAFMGAYRGPLYHDAYTQRAPANFYNRPYPMVEGHVTVPDNVEHRVLDGYTSGQRMSYLEPVPFNYSHPQIPLPLMTVERTVNPQWNPDNVVCTTAPVLTPTGFHPVPNQRRVAEHRDSESEVFRGVPEPEVGCRVLECESGRRALELEAARRFSPEAARRAPEPEVGCRVLECESGQRALELEVARRFSPEAARRAPEAEVARTGQAGRVQRENLPSEHDDDKTPGKQPACGNRTLQNLEGFNVRVEPTVHDPVENMKNSCKRNRMVAVSRSVQNFDRQRRIFKKPGAAGISTNPVRTPVWSRLDPPPKRFVPSKPSVFKRLGNTQVAKQESQVRFHAQEPDVAPREGGDIQEDAYRVDFKRRSMSTNSNMNNVVPDVQQTRKRRLIRPEGLSGNSGEGQGAEDMEQTKKRRAEGLCLNLTEEDTGKPVKEPETLQEQ